MMRDVLYKKRSRLDWNKHRRAKDAAADAFLERVREFVIICCVYACGTCGMFRAMWVFGLRTDVLTLRSIPP